MSEEKKDVIIPKNLKLGKISVLKRLVAGFKKAVDNLDNDTAFDQAVMDFGIMDKYPLSPGTPMDNYPLTPGLTSTPTDEVDENGHHI